MNNLTNNINSFKLEDLSLPVPNDAFRKIVKYLDPQSIQAALQVNTYFRGKTIKATRVKQNSLTEDFAKFLLGNLNPNLYQDQMNELSPFCDTKKFLFLSNLIEIKSSLLETKNVMINILKSLNLEDLNELRKLHLSQSKPDFFEDVFDIAIAEVSKVYQGLDAALAINDQNEREKALQKVCKSFIKVNNFNKAMEWAHTLVDINTKHSIFKKISQVLIKEGKLEKCINIFETVDDQYLKRSLFSVICESLAKNSYFDELTNFINKIEVVERVPEESIMQFKERIIMYVYHILLPLMQNSDNKIAINLAYSLEDLFMKIRAFSLICNHLIREGKLDQALELLDTLTPELLPGLDSEEDKWIVLEICTTLTEIGNPDKALEIIAARIHAEEMKASFIAVVSMGLVQGGNRAKALEIAHSINIQEIRERLLQQINSIPLNEDFS